MSHTVTELWVNKSNLRQTRAVNADLSPIEDGEILVRVDTFALTSNNITYAVSGNQIGYWHFFPTGDDGWGKVTVWGMADVIESHNADIKVGERLYGFFPMVSHQKLQPGNIKPGHFLDIADHRQKLPGLYNQYMRTQAEPDALKGLEEARCLYFPLFITGYVMADMLADNNWFGAEQVIVGSASSKTGIGTCAFIKQAGFGGQLVGLTSARNAAFVRELGLVDSVVVYDEVKTLDTSPSVYIDMAGDAAVRSALHDHLGDNMKSNQMVGLTHWEQTAHDKSGLKGARPVFFFAPSQIEKRNADWGPGVLMERGYGASAALAAKMKGQITVEHITGTTALSEIWRDFLDNRVDGTRGIMASLA